MVPRTGSGKRTNRRSRRADELALASRGLLLLAAKVENGFFAFVHVVVALAANEPMPFGPCFDAWSERSAHAGITKGWGRRFPAKAGGAGKQAK
jgi:hypothetical protein